MALAAYFTSAHAHAQRPKCSRTHVAPVQPGNRRVRADFLGVHQRRTRYGTGGCVAGSSSCHLGRDPRHEDAESQVGVDPAEFGADGERRQSRYEHAWEVRDAIGYTEFESAEEQVRAFVGARVWASQEGPRSLFDRVVVWLVEHRVLLRESPR